MTFPGINAGLELLSQKLIAPGPEHVFKLSSLFYKTSVKHETNEYDTSAT